MIDLREYLDKDGRRPFGQWLDGLDPYAAARVRTALSRLAAGNAANVRGVGGGVNELKIDFGPGYRVYFGWDGQHVVILVGGGTKRRQQQDITVAGVR